MCKMFLFTTRITLRISFMRLKNKMVKSRTGEKLARLTPQRHLVKQPWDSLMLKSGGSITTSSRN